MKVYHLLFAFGLIFQGCQSEPAEKPNVLWITLEDTSPQFMGYSGNDYGQTPVMDKLAKQSVIFNAAFSTATVCSPSRSTIITGMRTEEIGSGNHRSKVMLPEYIKGFPYYLKQEGYYTSNNVKTDYNLTREKEFIAEAWDESSNKAGWWNRQPDQPFFSVFNYIDCHQSRTMTLPWNWYDENVLNKLNPDEIISNDTYEMPPFYRDTKDMRKYMSRVYNSLKYTDNKIGELLGKLEAEGLKDETIIFVFADHGEGIPRGKTNGIGFGYRVPFYVWIPEKYKHLSPWENGSITKEAVCFEDLAPTILSVAGVEIPNHLNGRPFLGNKRSVPDEYVFGARNRIDESYDIARSVTDGRYMYIRNFYPHRPAFKYIKYMDVSDIAMEIRKDYRGGNLDKFQKEMLLPQRPVELLFDLESDPWELNNLAGNDKYRDMTINFREALKEQMIAIKDIHLIPEYQMLQLTSDISPYEYKSSKEYNIKPVVEAAFTVGSGVNSIQKQLNHLNDVDPVIRFWGAIGLKNRKDIDDETFSKIRNFLKLEQSPPVKIELASLIYMKTNDPPAFAVLKKYTLSDTLSIANHCLQNLVYMGEKSRDFLPEIMEARIKYADLKGPLSYETRCSVEILLYLLEDEPLYIPAFKKWLN